MIFQLTIVVIKNKSILTQFTLKFKSILIKKHRATSMQTPQNLLFSPQHLWAKSTADGLWEAGITDYAQNLLGDIVFVEAPTIGTRLTAEQPCGLVESVKTGSDLHALINGEVVEVNQSAIDSPEQINDKPYNTWIFKFKADNDKDAEQLLSAEAYETLINS